MKITEQKIKGIFLIEPEPFVDERGTYRRHFCKREFAEFGISNMVAQANIVENDKALTLRGFHYQKYPQGEAKTLSCLKGKAYDIVVDLRPSSPTYLKWIGFELSDKNRLSIHIPKGCAHAILTLEDNTFIHYYTSQFYAPKAELGIRYDDPFFNFVWPKAPKIVSKKDLSFPDFRP